MKVFILESIKNDLLSQIKTVGLLFVMTTPITQFAMGQSIKSTSKDSIILQFLNSKEVINGLKYSHKPETGILILIDPDNLLAKSKPTTWWGHPIKIITKGELVDSLNRFEPNYVIKSRNNYFIIRQSKSVDGTIVSIHAPFTNIYCTAILKKLNGWFYFTKFEYGVI